MIDVGILLSLVSLGLVSGAHCIGMCGGIMGALTMAIPAQASAQRWRILGAYNLGRILSYSAMGGVAGVFAAQFAALGGAPVLRIIAGLLLISMGLYIANWWRGLTRLETLGRYLWVYIQPIGKRLMPVDTFAKALLLGALWGWLPCGLVYAALAMAITQPTPVSAASAMLAFGLGTLPAVLAAGVVAQQLARILQQRPVRTALAVIIIIFGCWTIWGGLAHSQGHEHTHAHSPQTEPHAVPNHADMNHTAVDHSGMNHAGMNHAGMDHTGMNHAEQSSAVPVNAEHQAQLEQSKTITSSASSVSQAPAMHHH